jgi:lipopolysaccharide transport system ATP-binding protein
VAANLEPEILIVDEVLAVGDAEFQKKCLGKMKDVSQHGRTVLFVSHNMSAITTLTNRCIFLTKGQVNFIGDTASAIHKYIIHQQLNNQIYQAEPKPNVPSITRVEIFTSEPNNVHAHGKPMRIEFSVNMPYSSEGIGVSFQVLDNLSKSVMASWAYPSVQPLFSEKGKHTVCCQIPNLRLYMGNYSLTVGLADERGPEIFEELQAICNFEVQMYGLSSGHPYGWTRDVCTYIEDCEWALVK